MSETQLGGAERVDRILAALSHSRSRHVLHYLRAAPSSVATVDEIAEYVGTQERNRRREDAIAIDLHHATLPKLDARGIVDYDPRSKCVRYYEHQTVEACLDHAADADDDS